MSAATDALVAQVIAAPTPDPSQPPAPPGCVFGPAFLRGAWVAVVEGASGGAWNSPSDMRSRHTRAMIFSAAFGHERKRADAAEATARGVAEQLRATSDALTHARKVAATERALRVAVKRYMTACADGEPRHALAVDVGRAEDALRLLGVDP